MATNAYIGVNGAARKIKAIYVGVNGVARKVKAAYVGVANLARKWFGGGGVTVTDIGSASDVHASVNSAGAVNGTLIFCGGDDGALVAKKTTDRLYFLNYDTLTVTESSGGPEGYSIASATFKDGSKCVFAGGEGYQAGFLITPTEYWADNTVYMYDTDLVRTTLDPLRFKTFSMSGVATQNHVLFAGGLERNDVEPEEISTPTNQADAYSSAGVRTTVTGLYTSGTHVGLPLGGGAVFVKAGSTTVTWYNYSLVRQTAIALPVALSGVRAAEIEIDGSTGWALFGDSSRTYAINPSGVVTLLPAITGAPGDRYRAAMGIVRDGEPLALFVFSNSSVTVDANLVISEPQPNAAINSGRRFQMQESPANRDKFILNRSIYKAN